VSEPDARERAVQHMSELVLGAAPDLTREEAAAAVGIPLERARLYWRAMGFPDVGDRRAFTGADVEALALLVRWVDGGVLDEARAIEVVRSLGQTASRLADWQADTMVRILAASADPIGLEEVSEGLADVLPGLESLLVHAWRRHLSAVVGRAVALVDEPEAGATTTTSTVGFADIAGFTRLTRVLGEAELAAIVEAFETGAADIVAAHGGRVVKTLGDEVMFIAPTTDSGVAIALAMHRLPGPDGQPLRLRIGLASGRLVTLMGDYYGQTVNLASRLTAMSRPGGTLVDQATEESLADVSGLTLRRLRPRALRGLGLVRTTAVSRPRG
jgi:adenylate cyclase